MELLLGFALGIGTTIGSEIVLGLLRSSFPRAADHPIALMTAHPIKYFRHRRKGKEPIAVIYRLFWAWTEKDEETYQECWRRDATKIVGDYFGETLYFDDIIAAFRASCGRYEKIRVDYLTIERVEVTDDGRKAKVEVRYAFTVEQPDGFEAHERGHDRYALVLEEGAWAIARNWDRSDVT